MRLSYRIYIYQLSNPLKNIMDLLFNIMYTGHGAGSKCNSIMFYNSNNYSFMYYMVYVHTIYGTGAKLIVWSLRSIQVYSFNSNS